MRNVSVDVKQKMPPSLQPEKKLTFSESPQKKLHISQDVNKQFVYKKLLSFIRYNF